MSTIWNLDSGLKLWARGTKYPICEIDTSKYHQKLCPDSSPYPQASQKTAEKPYFFHPPLISYLSPQIKHGNGEQRVEFRVIIFGYWNIA